EGLGRDRNPRTGDGDFALILVVTRVATGASGVVLFIDPTAPASLVGRAEMSFELSQGIRGERPSLQTPEGAKNFGGIWQSWSGIRNRVVAGDEREPPSRHSGFVEHGIEIIAPYAVRRNDVPLRQPLDRVKDGRDTFRFNAEPAPSVGQRNAADWCACERALRQVERYEPAL